MNAHPLVRLAVCPITAALLGCSSTPPDPGFDPRSEPGDPDAGDDTDAHATVSLGSPFVFESEDIDTQSVASLELAVPNQLPIEHANMRVESDGFVIQISTLELVTHPASLHDVTLLPLRIDLVRTTAGNVIASHSNACDACFQLPLTIHGSMLRPHSEPFVTDGCVATVTLSATTDCGATWIRLDGWCAGIIGMAGEMPLRDLAFDVTFRGSLRAVPRPE